MGHNSDSDTSSEDSADDVEASAEDMEAIMTLENSLQASPQSYELHAQVQTTPLRRPPPPPAPGTPALFPTGPLPFKSLGSVHAAACRCNLLRAVSTPQCIAVLRKCGLKARLQSARKAMQKQFPLSERLWLDWLDDELKEAAKPKAQAAIRALFELAVQDYLSIAIWAEYLECALTLYLVARLGRTSNDHDEEVFSLLIRSVTSVTAKQRRYLMPALAL